MPNHRLARGTGDVSWSMFFLVHVPDVRSVLGYKLPKTVDVGGGINRYVTVCVNGSYISERVSDFMESNETLAIRADTPVPCSVMVTSKPAGAEIFVDGFATGAATPYCVGNLSAGRHLISVSKPGYTPAERTVVLAGPYTNTGCRVDLSKQ